MGVHDRRNPQLGGSLTCLWSGGLERALNGAWEFERPKTRRWVQVVFAGLVDNAKPRLGIADDGFEEAIDLPDLE
jgi:hypothetical protein